MEKKKSLKWRIVLVVLAIEHQELLRREIVTVIEKGVMMASETKLKIERETEIEIGIETGTGIRIGTGNETETETGIEGVMVPVTVKDHAAIVRNPEKEVNMQAVGKGDQGERKQVAKPTGPKKAGRQDTAEQAHQRKIPPQRQRKTRILWNARPVTANACSRNSSADRRLMPIEMARVAAAVAATNTTGQQLGDG